MRHHAAIAVLFLAAAPAVAEPITLRYGAAYSTLRSIYSLPIVVADREGFFRREGLDLKIVVPIPGGSDQMIDALHDGTVDVTHVATPYLIRSISRFGRGRDCDGVQQPDLQSARAAQHHEF